LNHSSARRREWTKVPAALSASTDLAAQARAAPGIRPHVEKTLMATPPERPSNRSGISEQEAQEFHGYFISMMTVFVGIALVAHLLMWMWRPWINVG
jgi:light-harvesting complex 1 beta chain